MKSSKQKINLLFVCFTIVSFVFTVSFLSCNNASNGSNPSDESEEILLDETNSFLVESSLKYEVNKESKEHSVSYKLPFSAFDDATVFNKKLAQVSLINSVKTESEASIKAFYSGIGFDNIVSKNATKGKTYDDNTVVDSISYTLAHKKLNDFDIVAVSVRGFGYKAEWQSNFLVGKSGDHEGFYSAAEKVYDVLKAYIEQNYSQSYSDKKLKLWVTGYSRAAAAANVLSYLMITDSNKKLDVEQKNMFVYTFASPRALLEEHALPYKNVFNIVSNTDLVTYVVPASWSFKRCGTDKVIFAANAIDYKEVFNEKADTYVYTTKLDDLLKALDPAIELTVFGKHEQGKEADLKYNSEPEMLDYYWNMISEKDETATGGISLKTRQLYAETVQYMAAYVYTLFTENSSKLGNVIDVIKNDGSYDFQKIMGMLSDNETFCSEIITIFDKAEIKYDDPETLKLYIGKLFDSIDPTGQNGCLSELFTTVLLPSVGSLLSGSDSGAAPDIELTRCIYAHRPECYFVLLNDYTE